MRLTITFVWCRYSRRSCSPKALMAEAREFGPRGFAGRGAGILGAGPGRERR